MSAMFPSHVVNGVQIWMSDDAGLHGLGGAFYYPPLRMVIYSLEFALNVSDSVLDAILMHELGHYNCDHQAEDADNLEQLRINEFEADDYALVNGVSPGELLEALDASHDFLIKEANKAGIELDPDLDQLGEDRRERLRKMM